MQLYFPAAASTAGADVSIHRGVDLLHVVQAVHCRHAAVLSLKINPRSMRGFIQSLVESMSLYIGLKSSRRKVIVIRPVFPYNKSTLYNSKG
jgi:hypothetical protein